MKIVHLTQGSPEWHEHRATHFNASDAPAMMGCSPYKTRQELVRELATGIRPEPTPQQQAIFADGHRFEALARPLAEQIIGQELFPAVGTEGKYSASFDGLTMLEEVAFEHKSLNETLAAAFADIESVAPEYREAQAGRLLPMQYQVQMEQQCMVSGCERVLFMASKWDREGNLIAEKHCWYLPNPELRAQIVAGWNMLEKDVAAYVPEAAPVKLVAEPIESLPTVSVRMDGKIAVLSNLDVFGAKLREFVAGIKKKPETDQDFANAEAAIKALDKAEDMLAQAESAALAQVEPVEAMRRAVADCMELARTTRLALVKLVKAEKDARKDKIVMDAARKLDAHIQDVNSALGAPWVSRPPVNFAAEIKGLKSLDSMTDKVAGALNVAIAAINGQAQRLKKNREYLRQEDKDWIALFADFATVGTKPLEDFQALTALRIKNFEEQWAAEEARAAEARAVREMAAKAAAATITGVKPEPIMAPVAAAPADDGEKMTLGQINTLLAPISITAAGLEALGFKTEKVRAAVTLPACQYPLVVDALVKHLNSVRNTAQAAAI